MTIRTVSIIVTALLSATPGAQAPPPAATPAATDVLSLTATSVNVKEPGAAVTLHLSRWSTDPERATLVAALQPPPADARGGDRGARAGAAGRAGGGGGRGRGAAAPADPIEAFTEALTKAPTLGYIWTTDVTGYAIKYAWHEPAPNGGEHIVLATTRRLGGAMPGWRLTAPGTPTPYDFTVLDLRLDARHSGEARTSLTTTIVADQATKTLALEHPDAAAAILHVTR